MSSGIQGLANMELKICSAFIKAATAKVDAKSLIQSVSNEINKQYSLHATQLFTQADGVIFQSETMEVKTDVSKAIAKPQLWMITAILTAIGFLGCVQQSSLALTTQQSLALCKAFFSSAHFVCCESTTTQLKNLDTINRCVQSAFFFFKVTYGNFHQT